VGERGDDLVGRAIGPVAPAAIGSDSPAVDPTRLASSARVHVVYALEVEAPLDEIFAPPATPRSATRASADRCGLRSPSTARWWPRLHHGTW